MHLRPKLGIAFPFSVKMYFQLLYAVLTLILIKTQVKCMTTQSKQETRFFVKAIAVVANKDQYNSCCVNPNNFTIDPKV